MNHEPINSAVWDQIRVEFGLPALDQVRRRLSEMMEDPEPVMQRLVRVFIDDGTFCPGFQFVDRGQLHLTVTALFRHAMDLRIPHNYFSAWIVTPSSSLAGSRPIDMLNGDTPPTSSRVGVVWPWLKSPGLGHSAPCTYDETPAPGWQLFSFTGDWRGSQHGSRTRSGPRCLILRCSSRIRYP